MLCDHALRQRALASRRKSKRLSPAGNEEEAPAENESANRSGCRSHLWQLVFVSFAVVLVLFEVIRGWHRGIARQLVRLAALIAAYFAAFFGGTFVVPLARPFFNLPDLVVSIIAGAALALIIYAIINGLGSVMFKRTEQYDSSAAGCYVDWAARWSVCCSVSLLFGWWLQGCDRPAQLPTHISGSNPPIIQRQPSRVKRCMP